MSASKINFQDITWRKLDFSDDLSSFSCTIDDDLGCDDFIHKEDEAKQYQRERLGITYLFFYDNEVIGFVTLSMAHLDSERLTSRFKKPISLHSYPSLFVGRLAVNNVYRKKGIGCFLCNWCLGVATSLSERVGCRYLILETSEGKKEEFYIKCNFQTAKKIKEDKENRVWMYQRIELD